MKKKKTGNTTTNKNNMDAMEDTYRYGAGQEADETISLVDDDTNGGIPDDSGDDIDEEEEDGDDDRA